MKGKVGILTYYYSNLNYGGQLQAFALQKKLSDLGFQAEQICYESDSSSVYYELRGMDKLKHLFLRPNEVICNRLINPKIDSKLRLRFQNFKEFKQEIPHSKCVYNDETVELLNDEYNAFVCGSDQIWKDWGVNSDKEKRNYFLQFAHTEKVILSYAVSLGVNKFSDEYQKLVKEELRKFKAISMREKSAVVLIQSLTEKKVEEVLDPVLLLDENDWKKCAKNPSYNLENEEYILAYFLGDNGEQRKIAKEYAKKQKCKLVVIPYAAHHKFLRCDMNFGDIREYNAGPREFVWYIQNAKEILTDSFHAMCFSTIFHKKFRIFLRDAGGKNSMNNRIVDFLECMGLTECIIQNRTLGRGGVLDYTKYDRIIKERRKGSIDFLMSNLK